MTWDVRYAAQQKRYFGHVSTLALSMPAGKQNFVISAMLELEHFAAGTNRRMVKRQSREAACALPEELRRPIALQYWQHGENKSVVVTPKGSR